MPSTGFGVYVETLLEGAFAAGFRAAAFFAAGFFELFARFFGEVFFFAMRGSLHHRSPAGQSARCRGKAGGLIRSTDAPSQRQPAT